MSALRAPAEPDVEFVRRLVLSAIASDEDLLQSLVLKGGNALRLIYRLVRRTTLDLDFSMADEFPDVAIARAKVFGALRRKLDGENLIVFDETLIERPKVVPGEGNPRHGGYQAKFKVIEREFDHALGGDPMLRRKYRHRGYEIDISKYEYCDGKERLPVNEGASIYVYTPRMIVLEKLRALCQQMPEYPYRANRSPRPEDFYDIHMVLQQTGVALDGDLEVLRHIFAAKEVDPRLLRLLPTTREFHRTQWEKVLLSAPGAGSFDEHFNFVIAKSAGLQSLWVE